MDNLGHLSHWDASAAAATTAVAAAGGAAAASSSQQALKPPGPAWLGAVVGQRGGAGSGARGWSLAPGGGAWRPGAGLSEPFSCCLLSAAAPGAEGTASGRRAADSQAARGKVMPGERAGGSSSRAAAIQVPERSWRPKLRLGAQVFA